MPLESGLWNVNVNGMEGQLLIQEVDNKGQTFGTIIGRPFTGFWDEVSQTLSITAQLTDQFQDVDEIRMYKGYMFSTPPKPEPGEDILWTLAGSVQATAIAASNAATVGISRRNVFGWFAQFKQVI